MEEEAGEGKGGGKGVVFKWKVVRWVWNCNTQRCGQGPPHQGRFLEVARTQSLQQESVGNGRERERKKKRGEGKAGDEINGGLRGGYGTGSVPSGHISRNRFSIDESRSTPRSKPPANIQALLKQELNQQMEDCEVGKESDV